MLKAAGFIIAATSWLSLIRRGQGRYVNNPLVDAEQHHIKGKARNHQGNRI
tara:strand:+ start:578 stop:730 length:153 start_codon:yes stop_codon:yes gene_type:complete